MMLLNIGVPEIPVAQAFYAAGSEFASLLLVLIPAQAEMTTKKAST